MSDSELGPTDSQITCRCGFRAFGPDQEANIEAYQDHSCAETGWQWFVSHLFSPPGMVIVFIVASVLVQLIGHVKIF